MELTLEIPTSNAIPQEVPKTKFITKPERGPDERLESDVWLLMNNYLGEHESYDRQSKVTKLVQEKMDFLTDGKPVEAVVVHDDTLNAFATPGYVVVTDGLLKKLEFEEELLALLAHESTHLLREHVEQGSELRGDLLRKVGKQRIFETEADLLGLDSMDKKGINTGGMKLLLRKLEQPTVEIDAKNDRYSSHNDPVHGSLADRQLNIDELTNVIDLKNLSDVYTPLMFSPEDFEEYTKDEDLWNKYDSLDTLSKRHFLQRQFLKLKKEYSANNIATAEKDSLARKAEELIIKQKALIDEHQTGSKDSDTLLTLTLVNYGLDIPLFQPWVERHIESEKELVHLFEAINNPYFWDLGITTNKGKLFEFGKKACHKFLVEQPSINIAAYIEAISTIDELDLTESEMLKQQAFNTLYFEPLINALLEKQEFNRETIQLMAQQLINTPVNAVVIEKFLTTKLLTGKKPNELTSQEWEFLHIAHHGEDEELQVQNILRKTILGRASEDILSTVLSARETILGGITEPVAFFHYLARYEIDLRTETVFESTENMFNQHGIDGFISALQKFIKEEKSSTSTIHAKERDRALEMMASRAGEEYAHNPSTGDFKGKDLERMSRLLVLYAGSFSKGNYIQYCDNLFGNEFDMEKLSLKDLQNLISKLRNAPAEARKIGLEIPWDLNIEDLNRLDRTNILGHLKERYLKLNDATRLVEFIQNYPIARSSGDNQKVLDKLTARMLQQAEGSLENVEFLEQLFAISCLSENTQILLQVPSKIVEKMVQLLPFQEAVNLVFDKYPYLPRQYFTLGINYLIEQKARTIEEFKTLEQRVKEEFILNADQEGTIGELAITDAFLLKHIQTREERTRKIGEQEDVIKGVPSGELLRVLLNTRDTDVGLKRFLFDRWWMLKRTGEENYRYFNIEDISIYRNRDENRIKYWVGEVPEGLKSDNFVSSIQDVYLANVAMKYATLRKLLVGEDGVLLQGEDRKNLKDFFFDSWVDQSSETEGSITQQLVDALLEVGHTDELYSRLNPLLMDSILKLPAKPATYLSLATEIAKEKLQSLVDRKVITNPNRQDLQILVAKLYMLMTGGVREEAAVQTKSSDAKLLELFSDERDDRNEKLSPWELAITVGEHSGAVGVRMLQLVGQCFDVPSEVKEGLMDVYDAVKGQSRLQAFRVLTREAEHSPEIRQLLEDVAEIRPRIGGGSLMTVYEVLLKNGQREAVAIKNPNAEYHVSNTIDLLNRTIDKAIEQNPENRDYQLLSALLSDVKQWILDELKDPDFEQKDQRFREKNDAEYGQFNHQNNQYRMLVPKSNPTGTRWVRRDEYVEGNNFTSLTVTDEPTDIVAGKINTGDFKQAVALLVKNYLYQISETGLVHSDIHPGNFRITADNRKLAVFDRYNLLELDDRDQTLVKGLITSFMMGGTDGARAQILDYILSLEENTSFAGNREQINNSLQKNSANQDLERVLVDNVVQLKRLGVHVPIKISLIGKNLQALNKIAKNAGFGNLSEVFF